MNQVIRATPEIIASILLSDRHPAPAPDDEDDGLFPAMTWRDLFPPIREEDDDE